MNRKEYLLLAGAFAIGLTLGILIPQDARGNDNDEDILYQVSTIDALLQGSYDGVMRYSDVRHHGDFGIATFDGLDGEMVAVDGEFFQVTAEGSVHPVADSMTTPFATVTFFSPDLTFSVPFAKNFTEFSTTAASQLPSRNLFYAVRITGGIPYIKARSIPRQEKPYPRLVDAAAGQSVFEFRNMTGTIVGFYTPEIVDGLNVPGFHLHAISADRTYGGHVLDLILENATVELDITPGFRMDLPASGDFVGMELTGNLSGDLAVVEQGTG
jgi:acetolactate decarboxylase